MSVSAQRPVWLFVDAIPHFGGHEVMLLRWMEELLQLGRVTPRLLARQGGRLLALAPESTRVEPIPPQCLPGRFRGLLNLWREGCSLRRALQSERPACVVFASGALGYQMLLVLMARFSGAQVLVYVPLLDRFAAMGYRLGWVKDAFVRWIYSRVPQGWVAVSDGQADQFRAWARPSGRVFVLPNTVARAIEAAPRLLPREVEPTERLRVLVLGRLDAHQKGLDLLLDHLEAASAVLEHRFRVHLAGEGPYQPAIEARCRAHPALARCVVLGGWMSAQQAMAENDVLLMPSRFEGVPLVMLEAMALGLPVVASDLPGMRGYLPDDVLFAVGDLSQAMQILSAMVDRDVRVQLTVQGRTRFETMASGRAFTESVAALTVVVERYFDQPAWADRIHEASH